MKIDAHHHLWRYDAAQYAWIDASMGRIKDDFTVNQLEETIADAGIDRTVVVQARQTVEETEWLLSLAEQGGAVPIGVIAGVVGWVPLRDAKVESILERFSARPALVGVRHVVQDEPDPEFLLWDDVNRGIASLRRYNLTYDLLVNEQHLPAAIACVDRHPEQPFVVDHIAKPSIRDRSFDTWARLMKEIARREHVMCKLSGVVTEADWDAWTIDAIRPYVEHVLSVFGPKRVMFGSDWPVCLLAASYRTWASTVRTFTATLSPDERDAVWGGTAAAFYRLPTGEPSLRGKS